MGDKVYLRELVIIAGYAHIILGIGSLAIPKMLKWGKSLKKVPVLIKQMFWIYAGYILGVNLFFGIVSILFSEELISKSGLATALTLFITLYWIARIIIQFTYFDKSEVPSGGIYLIGEWLLNMLFLVFSLFYGFLFFTNLGLV